MRRRQRPQLLGVLVVTAVLSGPLLASGAENYQVDPDHSVVIFRAGHLGLGAVYGRFRTVTGEFTLDPKTLAANKVMIEIDPKSIYTANKKRDEHLSGPDFLNVKQFPKIAFTSTKVAKAGKKFKVSGNLELHGKTQPVTVTMTQLGAGKDPWGNQRVGFEGEFAIKRSDWDITAMKEAVGEEIKLIVAIEGILKK